MASHAKGKRIPYTAYLDGVVSVELERIGKKEFPDVTGWKALLLRKIIREWLARYEKATQQSSGVESGRKSQKARLIRESGSKVHDQKAQANE